MDRTMLQKMWENFLTEIVKKIRKRICFLNLMLTTTEIPNLTLKMKIIIIKQANFDRMTVNFNFYFLTKQLLGWYTTTRNTVLLPRITANQPINSVVM